MTTVITVILFFASIYCTNEDLKVPKKHKWTICLPFITIALILYIVFLSIINATPEGIWMTNPVRVISGGETYYYNLQVGIYDDVDVDDDGHSTHYTEYYVYGYVDPSSGKLVKVECEDDESIADENTFFVNGKEYTVTLYKEDIIIPITEQIAESKLNILINVALIALMIRATVKIFKLMKAENDLL